MSVKPRRWCVTGRGGGHGVHKGVYAVALVVRRVVPYVRTWTRRDRAITQHTTHTHNIINLNNKANKDIARTSTIHTQQTITYITYDENPSPRQGTFDVVVDATGSPEGLEAASKLVIAICSADQGYGQSKCGQSKLHFNFSAADQEYPGFVLLGLPIWVFVSSPHLDFGASCFAPANNKRMSRASNDATAVNSHTSKAQSAKAGISDLRTIARRDLKIPCDVSELTTVRVRGW